MMANIIQVIQTNPKYDLAEKPLKKVRLALQGSAFVKQSGRQNLRYPNDIESNDPKFTNERYRKYLEGAEFDDFVEQTQRTMTGKLALSSVNIDLDSGIERLESDIDNDGTTIQGAMQEVSNNVLAAKYHIGLADYQGLSEVSTDALSIGELENLDPRSTIKLYPRESLVDWDFERVGGRMQCTYMMLREVESRLDRESLQRTDIVSYLILALDDEGSYYQEKLTQVEGKAGYERGERNYPFVDGVPLDFLPVYFFSDEELPKGELPLRLGYLSALSDIAYSKYSVSADYKEAMRQLPPTTYIKGFNESDWAQFQNINGRPYIATGAGAVNVLGDDCEVEIVGASTQLDFYTKYFEDSDEKVRALGGIFNTDSQTEKTAEEARINSAEQNAVLVGLAYSIKTGFTKLLSYCAMYEGLVSADEVDQYKVDIDINTEFGKVKLTPEEVNTLIQLYREMIFDEEELARRLKDGGWLLSDVDELLGRLVISDRQITRPQPVVDDLNQNEDEEAVPEDE